MKVIMNVPLRNGEEELPAGSEVDLDDIEAKSFLESGVGTLSTSVGASVDAPLPPAGEGGPGEGTGGGDPAPEIDLGARLGEAKSRLLADGADADGVADFFTICAQFLSEDPAQKNGDLWTSAMAPDVSTMTDRLGRKTFSSENRNEWWPIFRGAWMGPQEEQE